MAAATASQPKTNITIVIARLIVPPLCPASGTHVLQLTV
jgi:hypothetical protein